MADAIDAHRFAVLEAHPNGSKRTNIPHVCLSHSCHAVLAMRHVRFATRRWFVSRCVPCIASLSVSMFVVMLLRTFRFVLITFPIQDFGSWISWKLDVNAFLPIIERFTMHSLSRRIDPVVLAVVVNY